MSGKKLPYWIKGGVIGVLILLLLTSIFLIYDKIYSPEMTPLFGIIALTSIIILPIMLLLQNTLSDSWILLIFIILTVIIWFLIGAIIGFVIEKIKKKKSHN